MVGLELWISTCRRHGVVEKLKKENARAPVKIPSRSLAIQAIARGLAVGRGACSAATHWRRRRCGRRRNDWNPVPSSVLLAALDPLVDPILDCLPDIERLVAPVQAEDQRTGLRSRRNQMLTRDTAHSRNTRAQTHRHRHVDAEAFGALLSKQFVCHAREDCLYFSTRSDSCAEAVARTGKSMTCTHNLVSFSWV